MCANHRSNAVDGQSMYVLGGVVGKVCLREHRREEGKRVGGKCRHCGTRPGHEDHAGARCVRRAEPDPLAIVAGRDERRVGVADAVDVDARDQDDVAAVRFAPGIPGRSTRVCSSGESAVSELAVLQVSNGGAETNGRVSRRTRKVHRVRSRCARGIRNQVGVRQVIEHDDRVRETGRGYRRAHDDGIRVEHQEVRRSWRELVVHDGKQVRELMSGPEVVNHSFRRFRGRLRREENCSVGNDRRATHEIA